MFNKTVDGKQVKLFTLKNDKGAIAEITNYGGIIVSLTMPDRDGNMGDIVLGFDDLDAYIKSNPYFGALIGRYGNRIGNATFELDGVTYNLPKNDGENSLHGGFKGYDKVVWDAELGDTPAGPALKLNYTDPDSAQGYPGTVQVEVIYTLTNENELKVEYTGTTDKATVFNPTHHSYFNLTANPENTILDHELQINADGMTPGDAGLIPTGEIAPVEATEFDFRTMQRIGDRIDAENIQLTNAGGYDHNWVLNDVDGSLKLACTVHEPKTGRVMEVLTTEPGMQFYAGNFLDGTLTGKGGIIYKHRTGFCLESQHYPDSPNHPEFPTTVLQPGETYHQITVYKFSVR